MSTGGTNNNVQVNISGNTTGLEKELAKTDSVIKSWAVKIGESMGGLARGSQVSASVGNLAGTAAGMSSKWVLYAGAIAGATTAMLAFGAASAKAAETNEAGLRKQRAALKGVGNEAGHTKDSLQEMVDVLSQMGFENQDVRAGQTALIQLGYAGKELTNTLTAAAGLASYTGSSLAASSQQLGKVLSRPQSARRALSGVLQEKDLLRVEVLHREGKDDEAKNVILNRLAATTSELTGQFERSFTGQMAKMSDNLSDAMIELGTTLLPAFTALAAVVAELSRVLKPLAQVASIAIAPVVAVLQGLTGEGAKTAEEQKFFRSASAAEWEKYQTQKRENPEAFREKGMLEKASDSANAPWLDRYYFTGALARKTVGNIFTGEGLDSYRKAKEQAQEEMVGRKSAREIAYSEGMINYQRATSGMTKPKNYNDLMYDPVVGWAKRPEGSLDKNFGRFEGIEDQWKRINEASAGGKRDLTPEEEMRDMMKDEIYARKKSYMDVEKLADNIPDQPKKDPTANS